MAGFITKKVVGAFVRGLPCTAGNTSSTGESLRLHDNLIAWKYSSGSVVATLAGCPTPTTRERLNGLCELLGLSERFLQSGGEQFFGDTPIEPNEEIELVEGSEPYCINCGDYADSNGVCASCYLGGK